MTVEARQNPFPSFYGLDGLPLVSGYIYFGQANQDPRQYPVAVYYDVALTLPATQPLRTTNGYLYRNGAPTNVYRDGSCSVLVLDSAQRQVSYAAQWTGVADAAAAGAAAAAQPYVTQAQTAQGLAEVAKQGADAAALQAGNYAAAAATGAKFFDTIALGNAGVADGATFGVKAGGSDGLIRPTVYRRTSAGVSLLLYSVLPASEFDARFPNLAPSGYAFAIVDPDGLMAFGVRTDGTMDVANLALTQLILTKVGTAGALLQDIAPNGYSWAMFDPDGLLAWGLQADGTAVFGNLQATNLNGTSISTIIAGAAAGLSGTSSAKVGNFDSEISGFDAYGQSKSTGSNAVPVLTTSQRFDSLKFNGGVRATDLGGTAAADHASLQTLLETVDTGGTQGETPVSGMAESAKELIAFENSIAYTQQSYQFLGSCAGQGATAIAGLSSGTTPFNNLKDNIGYGYSLAQAAGKSYKFRAFGWSQGESDYGSNTAAATYQTALLQLRTDIDAYAKSVTGQADNVICIVDQVGAHFLYGHVNDPYLALTQLAICTSQPNFYMACPVYFLPKNGDPHFTNVGSKWLGAYYGLVYKRVVIDGGTWFPLMPLSAYRQGTVAILRMKVPKAPIVFDTTNNPAQSNMGFTLVDSAGTPITINSVSIIEKDTVKIVAAATIPAGAKLRYGFGGAVNNAGGNLRDSQGDTLVFNGGGLNKRMDNWAVIFEQVLA